MSGKPTLYKIGALVIQSWMSQAEKVRAETQPAIEFVVDYIIDRIATTRRATPKIIAKSPGDILLLLNSATGSGKSTVIAPAVLARQECTILVTQPRVLTTVEIVHDIVRRNKDLTLGDNIGYQTGVIKRKPTRRKGINFVTTGVLLQQFITKGVEWVAETYSVIFIDEVHERSIDVELLLSYVKSLSIAHWNKRYPLIVLMSATFNKTLYQKYFDIPARNYIEVTGFSYPIQEVWQNHDVVNYVTTATSIVRDIHINNTDDYKHAQRDIIIFVKGEADIKLLLAQIWKLNEDTTFVKKAGYIYPLGLNREIFIESGKRYQDIMSHLDTVHMTAATPEEQKELQLLKLAAAKPSRRVIIATNVAETGVTIETLKYCIDTGYVMNVWVDSLFDTEVIMSSPVTQFMARQRKGRVGRKAPGIWYPLFTQKLFNQLQIDQPSKMITEDITNPLLNLIITNSESKFTEIDTITPDDDSAYNIYLDDNERHLQDDDEQYSHVTTKQRESGLYKVQSAREWKPSDLDLLELPSADSMFTSLDKLLMLGFIDDSFIPTPLGCMANKIRKISPESLRMIFAGYSYGANILDLITIAAFEEIGWIAISEVPRFKYQPRSPLGDGHEKAAKLTSKILWGCEFIEYLWIWYEFTAHVNSVGKSKNNVMDKISEWCTLNKFNMQGLLDVVIRRDEYISNFIVCDMNPFYNGLGLERGTYNLSKIMRDNHEAGIREIQKIKRCLVDGYRYYICRWDNKTFTYRSIYKHIPIYIDNAISRPTTVFDEQVRPQLILCSGIILRQKFQSDMFEYMPGGAISILDGFITFDDTLIL